jgi:hypothetical protein
MQINSQKIVDWQKKKEKKGRKKERKKERKGR